MTSNVRDEHPIKLANGCLLRIRRLRRGEDGPIRELFARLSPRTRYLRFFSEMPAVPESVVRMLADVDDVRRIAMIAELDDTHGGHVVALGNVGFEDDRAELGIVVADAWQRQGIGVALTASLLLAAEACGQHRFVVYGLWENQALLRLLNHVADVESTVSHRGVFECTFVRRQPAPLLQPSRVEGIRTIGVEELLQQAYERILASQGRESDKRRIS